MKRKIMEKKQRFQYCTAVMATVLLVSANGFSTAAQESGNTKTMQSFIYLETIDSGGSQESTIKQKLLSQTAKENMVIEYESSSMPESNALENTDTSIEETSFDSISTVKESSSILESASAGENETVSNTNHNSENTDTEVADIKVTETEVADIKVTDTEVADIKVTDTEVADIKVTETEVADIEVTETEVADIEVTETEVADIEITETEVAKTEVVETEIAETEITETEVVETEVTETEIVESPSTNGSDTVETESDPSNTENGSSCICDIRCSDSSVNQNCSVCTENFADCTATIIIDLIETPINENVVWFCSLIDSMPTAEQLYAEAPNSRDELYNTWLSETKEILLQIGELQEQYRQFTDKDKNFIGVERKNKLEALGEMAEKLLEDNVVYDVDQTISEDDSPLRYMITVENNNVYEVKVIANSNYGTSLNGVIEIPETIHFDDKEYKVTSIDSSAFSECKSITNVIIPSSIKNIGASAFKECTNLTNITLFNNLQIGNWAFEGCTQLSTMTILVPDGTPIIPITVANPNAFGNCPSNRNIVFQTADGTELTNKTTPRLVTAFNAYRTVDDGNTNDDLWYGWKLKTPTFAVTPNINKDNAPWSDHNRIFALKMADSDELITDLTAVKNGTYTIVDITTDSNNPFDTGASVTVNDDDTTNDQPINYYTVTFYDPDNAYDNNTAQSPQIILKDQLAVQPPDPIKDGFTFDGWKTAAENGQPFDFESTKITQITSIYASWIDNTKPKHKVTIKVRLDDTEWTNHNKTFMLKSSDNSLISPDQAVDGEYSIIDTTSDELDTGITVTVGGSDAEATVDYYTITFYNDSEVHNTQIVLKGQTAKAPSEPTKEGYTFVKWKISQDGDTEFNMSTPITARTDVYADWSTDTYYTITPSKEGNGTISPDKETKVKSGDEIVFTFTPENGYHIKEILVDDIVTQISENTYTFTNVIENHTIKVIFEADDPNDKDDNPGGDDDKPGDNPGGDDNKPGDNPGGDDNKPGNNPDGDDDKPGDNPGGNDNKPGDNPGGDDDKPGDNPGSDDDKPGDNPGDDNKPDDNPGGDDDKPSDNPGGSDNKPDDNNKPDNDNKPSDDNNKPSGGDTPTTGGENSSGNSNLNDSSPTSSSTVSSAASNPAAVGTMPSAVNIAPNSIDPNATIPNDITDSAYITAGNIAPEGTFSDSAKDAEPQTGEAYGIERYALLAIIASIILLLLQLLETRKRKNTMPTEKKEESWQPPLNTPIFCCKALPQKQNNLIFNYQEIKKKPAKPCLPSIMENFKHWHTKQQNNNTLNLIVQQHFQQNHYKILGVIWTKRKQYFCLSG